MKNARKKRPGQPKIRLSFLVGLLIGFKEFLCGELLKSILSPRDVLYLYSNEIVPLT